MLHHLSSIFLTVLFGSLSLSTTQGLLKSPSRTINNINPKTSLGLNANSEEETFIYEEQPDYNLIQDSKLISRVLYISDAHWRGDSPYADGFVRDVLKDYQSLNLETDAAICLGDLSQNGAPAGSTTNSLTNWYDFIDTKPLLNTDGSGVQFYGILGNHDVRGADGQVSDKEAGQKNFLNAAKIYKQREAYNGWGKDKPIIGSYGVQKRPDINYVQEINGYHYMFINSCEFQNDICMLTLEDLDWIDLTLTSLEQTDKNKPIFVLVHQPIDYQGDSISVLDEDGNKMSDNYKFIKMMSKHETSVILTGHTHAQLGLNHLFKGVYYNGYRIANYLNFPSLEYNNYNDYKPMGVEGYELKTKGSYSNLQYYVCEIYENGVLFKARDGSSKEWVESSFYGILNKGEVEFKTESGETISKKTYNCGDLVEVPDAPAVAETPNHQTKFKGWSPRLSSICHGDTTYIATYVRKPNDAPDHFTVTFDTNGHGNVISPMQIEYGMQIEKMPIPSETDYIFEGWYKEKELINEYDCYVEDVMNDITLYAKWSNESDVEYTVEHYIQNIEDDEYVKFKIEKHKGPVGELTNAVARQDLEGFHILPFVQEQIKGDGSTVIKIYYDRDTFKVNVKNNDKKGTVTITNNNPRLDSDLTIVVKPNKGYEIKEVLVNDKQVQLDKYNSYIVKAINADITIEVTYNTLPGFEEKKGCAGSIATFSLIPLIALSSLVVLFKKKD